MTENEYQQACRDIARNGTLHFFDPWKEPGKFGAWAAYWKRNRIYIVMVRCVMNNSWPSETIATPTEFPREFDRRNADMQSDVSAANAWISEIKRMARRGELPIGVHSRLTEGGIDLPPLDADVRERRERIKKGFELLRQGRHDEAKRAVMPSVAPQKAAERDRVGFWYDDM